MEETLIESNNDIDISKKPKPKKSYQETKNRYSKKWYKANKEKHAAYMAEKIPCECGEMVRRNSLRRHQRSKVHGKWMELIVKAKQDQDEKAMNAYFKEKDLVKCICGNYVLIDNIQYHLKTPFHTNEIEKRLREGHGHVYDYDAKYDLKNREFYMP